MHTIHNANTFWTQLESISLLYLDALTPENSGSNSLDHFWPWKSAEYAV